MKLTDQMTPAARASILDRLRKSRAWTETGVTSLALAHINKLIDELEEEPSETVELRKVVD